MKVQLLVSRSGPDGTELAGDEINVSEDEAKRLLASGQAVPVRAQKAERTVKTQKVEKT